MYSDIIIFVFAIVFIFDNHVFQFIPKTTLIISQGSGLFIIRKDIKNSSNDTYDSQFIGNLNRITGNINSNDTYWVAQNFSNDKDLFKTSKKKGKFFSRGNKKAFNHQSNITNFINPKIHYDSSVHLNDKLFFRTCRY